MLRSPVVAVLSRPGAAGDTAIGLSFPVSSGEVRFWNSRGWGIHLTVRSAVNEKTITGSKARVTSKRHIYSCRVVL